MPPLASSAYGASAHASTAKFYAGHENIETVVDAGKHCAWALLLPLEEEYPDVFETTWIWNFAVKAINVATDLCAEDRA